MVTCSRDTATATLTLSSVFPPQFLLSSLFHELWTGDISTSTFNLFLEFDGWMWSCGWRIGGGGSNLQTFHYHITEPLTSANQPSNLSKPLSSHAFLLSCFLNYSFYIFLLIPTWHEKIWISRRSVSVCWVKVWSCYLMESWSYFTAWSYNEIGASKKSSTNLTNDTIYSGSKGMATGGLKSLDWYLLMLLLAS